MMVNPSPNQPSAWNAFNHLQVAAIPEPSTMTLLGLGLLVLAYFARRRSK